jgi:hypothetical protein
VEASQYRRLNRSSFVNCFLWSAAAILALTGLGKISSAFGAAEVLTTADPIVGIPFRVLLPLAGSLELIIAGLCVWKRFLQRSRLLMVAWVSTMFVVYRIGLWAMNWQHPCGCMGSLAGVLHMSDAIAETIMRYLLGYLFTGSSMLLATTAARDRTVGASCSVLIMAFSLICIPRPLEAADAGNLEAFKARLAEAANCREVEFLEGDVRNEPKVTVTNLAGRMMSFHSQRHYTAVYQTNGFVLRQKPEIVSLDSQNTNVEVFADCGRLDSQVWIKRDAVFVRVVDMNIPHTNAELKGIIQEVEFAEAKAVAACFLGLPPMDGATLTWDGLAFSGRTYSGETLHGELRVEDGLVVAATYRLTGGTKESGRVDYSYSSRDQNALPDILGKRVDPYMDPLDFALRPFSLKVLNYHMAADPLKSEALAAATRDASYLISNGVPLTRVGPSFLPRGTGTLTRPARPFALEQGASRFRARFTVGLFVAVTFGLAGFAVYRSTRRKAY